MKKVKQLQLSDLDNLLIRFEYKLDDHIIFEIYKRIDNKWCIYMDHRLSLSDGKFKFFGDKVFGGQFKTLLEAQNEIVKICQYYITPFTNKSIRKYFNMKWMKKEEQSKELMEFRETLLNKHWKMAANIYNNHFSNWTKESIPDLIVFQVSRNL